jgi:hypothetical protein
MNRSVLPVALIAALAVAAPASAKQTTRHLGGTADNGSVVSFDLKGKRVSRFKGSIETTCVPDHGPTTLVHTINFQLPGSIGLGQTRKLSVTQSVPLWGDTTFNYEVSIKKAKRHAWHTTMRVNYSYLTYSLGAGTSVNRTVYICQGEDGFDFK